MQGRFGRMWVPLVLCALCAGLVGVAFAAFGPVLSDLMLLALVAGLASLILLLINRRRGKDPDQQPLGKKPAPQAVRRAPDQNADRWPKAPAQTRPATPLFRTAGRRWILVDGSNVMHWKDDAPNLETVREVLADLTRRGYTPGVMFDANVGYRIGTRYMDDAELARRLGLPADRVLVVPKGTPADAYLLQAADKLAASVVSNDRFRDWAAAHPQVNTPGFLIRGGCRGEGLWLDEAALAAAAVPA